LKKEHLFEDNGSPRLIGVALTSPDSPGERCKAIAAGFNVLLEKPVDPLQLLHAVLELSSTPRTATRHP
jgi:CheY-like chemotaxis protein